jgi:glycosyltransferase involved in cell wall biosynthesis
MRVLLSHNFYQEPGGEDQVFFDEAWLLEQHGHTVLRYEKRNSEIEKMGKWGLARSAIWNGQVVQELDDLMLEFKPDIVHFHNTFPLISPAAYVAVKRHDVPVVQTLHNFRMICPAATLVRDGKICQKCTGKTLAWPAIQHKCYRNSRAATSLVVASNAFHKMRRTWIKNVDAFITLTDHSRRVFAESGIPEKKLTIKPNFVRPDPGVSKEAGEYAIFVGRLSHEKGIDVLLEAWGGSDPCTVPLVIVGDGPMRESVAKLAAENPLVSWLGQLPFDNVLSRIREAKMLLMPSIWFETFGRTMIEAFASGIPVVASNIGAMQEIVIDGYNGFHFQVGSASDLLAKVTSLDGDSQLRSEMGKQARRTFLNQYSMARNYDLLIDIYQNLLSGKTS